MTTIYPQGLAPGIYFNLSSDVYHQDPALGSSDIRLIKKNAPRYWRQSALNPDAADRSRYKKKMPALEVGTAMHTLVLDGDTAFKSRYRRRPDDAPGADGPAKGAATRAFKKTLLMGEQMLHGDDYQLCLDVQPLVEQHPDLGKSFNGGANEVSVFWRRTDGVMCKARYDRFKAFGIGDIKSIENERDDPLDLACHWAIKKYRYDIQIEHYLESRRHVPGLVGNGLVFYAVDDGLVLKLSEMRANDESSPGVNVGALRDLVQTAAEADIHGYNAQGEVYWLRDDGRPQYRFIIIFIQKSYPDVWAWVFSPGNPKLMQARALIELTIDKYKQNFETFGTKPWRPTWRLSEYAWEDAPGGEFGWS